MTCSWLRQQDLWFIKKKKKNYAYLQAGLIYWAQMITGIPSDFFTYHFLHENCYFSKLDCNQGHPRSLLKIKYHLVFVKNIIKNPMAVLFQLIREKNKWNSYWSN